MEYLENIILVDTHAHLNDVQFEADQVDVIKRAQDAGIRYIVNVGYNKEMIETSLALSDQYDFIYTSIGWHPHYASLCTVSDVEWLRLWVDHPKVVALGEMGLDYYRDHAPYEEQADLFRRQLHLAKETGLPVIIHNREADEDVMRILQEEDIREVGGVMHCFGGDLKMMEDCFNLNMMIGLGGPVTFKNAKQVKEVAREVPLNRLLIETDCPYLAPHPHRGKRNEPAYVKMVAQIIAEIKGISLEECARVTTENALRLFRIPSEVES